MLKFSSTQCFIQATQSDGKKDAEVPVSIGVKTTDREINPEFENEEYNGNLDVNGEITDLGVIVATANDSDKIVYELMGKFPP